MQFSKLQKNYIDAVEVWEIQENSCITYDKLGVTRLNNVGAFFYVSSEAIFLKTQWPKHHWLS